MDAALLEVVRQLKLDDPSRTAKDVHLALVNQERWNNVSLATTKRACSHAAGWRMRRRAGEHRDEHRTSIDEWRVGSGGVAVGTIIALADMGRRKSMSAAATKVAAAANANLIQTHLPQTPSSSRTT